MPSLLITHTVRLNDGSLYDPPGGVSLNSPNSEYGVRIYGTDTVVVPANTAMTKLSPAIYTYSIPNAVLGVVYEYSTWVDVMVQGVFGRMFPFTTGLVSVAQGTDVNLREVRRRFIQRSLRYDLVVDGNLTTNVDAGANEYINQAQHWLDHTVVVPSARRRYFKQLSSGTGSFSMRYLIAIEEVFITNAEEKTRITKNGMSAAGMRERFGAMVDWESGTPVYWAMDTIGLSPMQVGSNAAVFDAFGVLDYDSVMFGSSDEYKGILLYPKADGAYTCEIVGKFYCPKLVADEDVSFWTMRETDLLVLTSCYMASQTLQSASGSKMWMDLMEPMLVSLDNVAVDDELSGLALDWESVE